MKKPKITKGEWKVNKEHPNIVHCNGGRVANTLLADDLSIDHYFNRDAKVNAKAISAVPEMIDALIEVQHTIDECRLDNGGVALGDVLEEKVKSAIIKAGCTS